MQVTIELNEVSQAVLKMAIRGVDITPEKWLSERVNKLMEQQELVIVRSRLNLHKRTVAHAVNMGAEHYKTLQQAYNSLGMSAEVAKFGGIDKVYNEIFVKTGTFIPKDKVRETIAVVPAPANAAEQEAAS